jgi:hypothetical protein
LKHRQGLSSVRSRDASLLLLFQELIVNQIRLKVNNKMNCRRKTALPAAAWEAAAGKLDGPEAGQTEKLGFVPPFLYGMRPKETGEKRREGLRKGNWRGILISEFHVFDYITL